MARAAVVDSTVLIGAFLRRDSLHEPCLRILRAADAGHLPPLLLTDFLLAEVLNFVTRKAGSPAGRDVLRRIEESPGFVVERVSEEVYRKGKDDIYCRIDGLSFVDALTAAFMEARGIDRIYTFDSGFDRLPGVHRSTEPS